MEKALIRIVLSVFACLIAVNPIISNNGNTFPPETCEEFVKKYPARYEVAKNAILAIKDLATATKAEFALNELNNPFENAIRKECLTKADEMAYESEILNLINRFRANAKPYLQDIIAPEIVALFAELKNIEADAAQLTNPESVAALKRKLEYAKQNFEAYRYKAYINDNKAIALAFLQIEETIAAKQMSIPMPLQTGVKTVKCKPKFTLVLFGVNAETDTITHKLAKALKQKKEVKLRAAMNELLGKTETAVSIPIEIKLYEYQQFGKKYWGIQSIIAEGGKNNNLTVEVAPSAPETGNGVSSVHIEVTVTRGEVEVDWFDWDAIINLPKSVINDMPTMNATETADVMSKLITKNTYQSGIAKSNIGFVLQHNHNDPNQMEFTITKPSEGVFGTTHTLRDSPEPNLKITTDFQESTAILKTEVEALLNK